MNTIICASEQAKGEEQATAPAHVDRTVDGPGQESAVAPAVVTLKDYYRHVEMPARPMDKILQVGEKLVYRIHWKQAPAGEATFTVKRETTVRGRPAFYVAMETESNDAVSLIYKVRDKVKSYIDVQTGATLHNHRIIREGTYRKYEADEILEFDYEADLQRYTSIKGEGDREEKERPIPGLVQDPLSVIYYLRHFPLAVGETRDVLVATRKRTSILQVQVQREEEVRLPGIGAFDAYVVNLANGGAEGGHYDPNIFVSSGEVTLWVEKNTNIPLQISVGVPVLGQATATLVSYENAPLAPYLKKTGK